MSKRRIVACGGGDPTTSMRPLLDLAWDLTDKEAPRILLVTSAAPTQEAHDDALQAMTAFATENGMEVDTLHSFGGKVTRQHTTRLLERCDLTVIIDGDLERMRLLWRNSFIMGLFSEAIGDGDIVALGLGVGAAWLFDNTFTDTARHNVEPGEFWVYKDLTGLELVHATVCPGYDEKHPTTIEPVMKIFQGYLRERRPGTVGIGIGTNAALVIEGDTVSVVSNGKPGIVHRLHVGEHKTVSAVTYAPGLPNSPDDTGIPLSKFTSH